MTKSCPSGALVLLLLFIITPFTQAALSAQSIEAISPNVHVLGTSPSITLTPISPFSFQPSSVVAFALLTCDNGRVGVTSFPSTNTSILVDSPAFKQDGRYRICLTDGTGSWVSQKFIVWNVIGPSATNLNDLSPSEANYGTLPQLTTTSFVNSAWSQIGFSSSNCENGTIYGISNVTDLTFNIQSPVPNPGIYNVCFSVDRGLSFQMQTNLTFAFRTVSSAPLNPQISSVSPSTFTLEWEAPLVGYTAILGYRIWIYNGETVLKTVEIEGAPLFSLVTGLSASTTYNCSIAALNAVGEGEKSTLVQLTTLAPTAPGRVEEIFSNATSTTLFLKWQVPDETGGIPIASYNLTISKIGSQSSKSYSLVATQILLTDLQFSSTYQVILVAKNPQWGGPEAFFNFSTLEGFLPGSPSQVTATGGPTSITVSWVAPDPPPVDAVFNYKIYYGISSPSENFQDNGVATAGTLDNLKPKTTYQIQVTAQNVIGEGSPSPIFQISTSSKQDPVLGWMTKYPWYTVTIFAGAAGLILVGSVVFLYVRRKIRTKRREKREYLENQYGLDEVDTVFDIRY